MEKESKERRPMARITVCEVSYQAVGLQREAVDGDVIFQGEIAQDVTPGELFQKLQLSKARIVDLDEAPAAGKEGEQAAADKKAAEGKKSGK